MANDVEFSFHVHICYLYILLYKKSVHVSFPFSNWIIWFWIFYFKMIFFMTSPLFVSISPLYSKFNHSVKWVRMSVLILEID